MFPDHKNSTEKLLNLLQIMQKLRAPDGCPWDAEQTPQSLAPYILEEACELIDAIESGKPEDIQDELGDLLLQIVFQAQIFQEQQLFNFADVADGIAKKLTRRHPHVFSSAERNLDQDQLSKQWHTIKNAERTEAGQAQTPLAHIPPSLPALQRAQKTVTRIKQAGLCERLPSCDELDEKLDEEQLGQALFVLVRRAEAAGLDAESALRKTMRRLLEGLNCTSGTDQ